MTAMQLNTDIYRSLGVISEDESVLRKVAKYLSRLAKQMTDDPTRMTKEEYFAMLEEAEQGPSHSMLPGEDLTTFLKRRGYDL